MEMTCEGCSNAVRKVLSKLGSLVFLFFLLVIRCFFLSQLIFSFSCLADFICYFDEIPLARVLYAEQFGCQHSDFIFVGKFTSLDS